MMHHKVIAWSKNQMYEGVISLVIAALMIFFTSTLCAFDVSTISQGTCYTAANKAPPGCGSLPPPFGTGYVTGWAPVGQVCPIAATCNVEDVGSVLLSEFRDATWTTYVEISGANSILSWMSSYSFDLSFNRVGVSTGPFSGLSQMATPLSTAMSLIAVAHVLVQTQMILLRVIDGIFVILLPAGVLLRSLGATRGFGGSLIAIAIGIFFVYPYLVVLFYGDLLNTDISLNGVDYGTFGNICSSFPDSASCGAQPGCVWNGVGCSSNTAYQSNNAVQSFQQELVSINISDVMSVLSALPGLISSLLLNAPNLLTQLLMSLFVPAGISLVGSFIIPVLMFMVLISFIKGLSKVIGEEVDVSNLMRLI